MAASALVCGVVIISLLSNKITGVLLAVERSPAAALAVVSVHARATERAVATSLARSLSPIPFTSTSSDTIFE